MTRQKQNKIRPFSLSFSMGKQQGWYAPKADVQEQKHPELQHLCRDQEDGLEASPGILQTSFDVFLQCAQCKHTFPSHHPQTLWKFFHEHIRVWPSRNFLLGPSRQPWPALPSVECFWHRSPNLFHSLPKPFFKTPFILLYSPSC